MVKGRYQRERSRLYRIMSCALWIGYERSELLVTATEIKGGHLTNSNEHDSRARNAADDVLPSIAMAQAIQASDVGALGHPGNLRN